MGTEHHPLEVHVDEPGVVGDGHLPEQPHDADRSVVDPHVDVTETLLRRRGELLDGVRVADVGRHCHRAAAGPGDLRDDLLQRCGPPGGDDDVGTPLTECQCRAAAESARGTRDDDRTSRQVFPLAHDSSSGGFPGVRL
jgi:hypothetical protein